MAAKKLTKTDWIIAIVIVLGLAGIAAALFGQSYMRDSKEKAEKRAVIEQRTKELIEAKTQIAGRLRDPSSPIFTDVKISQIGDMTPTAICGNVNGKNGFGAYAGAHRFFYVPGSNLPMIDDGGETRALFEQHWGLLNCETARAPMPAELVEGTEVNTDLTPR